jgi:hypothetical protein
MEPEGSLPQISHTLGFFLRMTEEKYEHLQSGYQDILRLKLGTSGRRHTPYSSGSLLFVNYSIGLRTSTINLTPRNRVLPEKLTDPQLVKIFTAFYGTRRFTTSFTRARYLPLPLARSIPSKPHLPAFHSSKIHFNIILPSTPGSVG